MNFKAKKSKGIIYPVKGRREPSVGPDALMVMIPSELRYLVQVAKAQKASFNDMSLYHLYQVKDRGELPVYLSGPFMGAPHAVIAMEKLVVLGAERIWVLGWCGSLQRDLRIGHIVIPINAVSEEGTSRHYPIGEKAPQTTTKLNEILEDVLKKQGFTYSKGPVWTTDALYRETSDKVKTYQAQGILAVEMETSALMTVAIYRSVSIACLLVVSDELFDLTWRPGFSNPLLKKNSHAAGKVLLSLATSLTHRAYLSPESPPKRDQ